eukprot:gene314-944_t
MSCWTTGIMNNSSMKKKIVHLDLKGAPPKIHFLVKIIPLLRQWGATGLLVEYEDMFPFRDELKCLSKDDAYTSDDIRALQDVAKTEGMDFIPLVQTFGHMEFVLKNKQFEHLRELPQNPMAVCPSNDESLSIVESIIDQLMSEHDSLTYLHVGGDESQSKAKLYLKHMISVLTYIKSKWPSLKILIWDDMFREFSTDDLQELASGCEVVIPVAWSYGDDLRGAFPNGMFERFAEVFDEIWIASSFKGSAGPVCNWTPIPHYINNHLSWLSLVKELPSEASSKIKTIVITGWSRYDHYASLCELLPVALPCLAICLSVIKEERFSMDVHEKVSRDLGYLRPIALEYKPFMQLDDNCGNFPGSELITYITYLENAKQYLKMAEERKDGWMDSWRIEVKKEVNMCHVEFAFSMLTSALQIFEGVKSPLQECLSFHFSDETVEEFIVVKVDSQMKIALNLMSLIRSLKLTPDLSSPNNE